MELSENSKNFSKGFFIVSGSNLIRLGEIYKLSVFCYGYKNEEELLMRIVSNDKSVKQPDFKKIKLIGENVQTVDFEIANIENDYILEVKNESGERFESKRSLDMNMKKYSVFVQTDKSIYKPSDKIQFRVLALNGETKPLNTSSVEIFITDGAENRVKQFDKPEFHKGVFQNELQLSDLPVMGTWKIHIKINGGEEIVKSFDVAEYVLPKFEVKIDSNPDVTFKDGKIRATVKATYTFGKIAKGNATVSAEVVNEYGCGIFGWNHQPGEASEKKVTKTVEVDGKSFIEFDMEKDLKIMDVNSEKTVKLTASFKEELSGKEATASTDVKIHVTPHKIELKTSNPNFKPGLPFDVTAILKLHDKSAPVSDDKNAIKFSVTYYWDILRICKHPEESIVAGRRMRPNEQYEVWESQSETKDFDVYSVNGFAKLNIDLKKNITHFSIKAKYLDTEEHIHHVQKMETACDEYIMARLLTEKPVLSENVPVEILSTKPITSLSYHILGRGSTIEGNTVNFESTEKYILNIKPSFMMIPKAQLVVYYLSSDGEIVSDRVEIEFGNELINHVDIKLSSEQAKPGSNLDISVSTRADSFVGLLGVDQSVLLLKKGNDIEPSMIYEDLEKYGTTERYNYSYYHPGHDKDNQDFNSARALIITNTKEPFVRRIQPTHHYRAVQCAEPMQRMAVFGARKAGKMMAANVMADDMVLESTMMVGSAPAPPRQPIEVRKTFPETWLFDSLEFDSDQPKVISKKVPDTITSWIITGFSIDPSTGLGITKQPTKFNVFQPFFVSTNLPYSLKRGEVVSIPVILFNYLEEDQDSEVTLFNNDGEFEFIDTENSEDKNDGVTRSKKILVKSNEGATVSFMIRPLKVGNITIKINAESAVAGDGIERQLKIEPEGVTQFFNEAMFIDLRTTAEFAKKIAIEIPENAVPDSTHIEISAIGDILGPSISNLDKLIQLPYGCGEQNMLNFVPNIVVLDYLTSVKRLTPVIEAKAKKFMETGYQRELTYKHDNGSYSAFGKSDQSGSTWLTAFVAKSFFHASKYIHVDKDIIRDALNFLSSVQTTDGSFPEVGYICHKDMQGGSSKGIALTAYTLITFMEVEDHRDKFKETIQKALNYIIENFEQLNDNYSLALATYALQLAQHEKKNLFMTKLESKAESKDGLKHWKKELKSTENDCPWHRPTSVNVEMSAYALQAYIEGDHDTEGISIMKWLISQRNENGGFNSTQDTVVGLQALSKLASKIYDDNSDIEINVNSDNSNTSITVNSSNSLILQKHEISSLLRNFEVSAKGKGFSILQISYKYNLDDSGKFPRFKINPVIENVSSKEFLQLSIGVTFIPDEQTEKSNMAVMEVSLPSGFTFDTDHLPDLLATERVKKVETKDGDTIIIIYFDDVDAKEIQPKIKAFRTHKVANQKPAPIVVYDYYDNSRKATTFYSPPEISIADIDN